MTVQSNASLISSINSVIARVTSVTKETPSADARRELGSTPYAVN
jgi:hypothetical protein